MRNAHWAAVDSGMMDADLPLRGWDVSCDARLFATEYPGMPVITGGVGALADAHADSEHITLDDLTSATAFFALFLLRETGAL